VRWGFEGLKGRERGKVGLMRTRYFLFAIVKSNNFHSISLPEKFVLVSEAAI
jgi:hypothetical protein